MELQESSMQLPELVFSQDTMAKTFSFIKSAKADLGEDFHSGFCPG